MQRWIHIPWALVVVATTALAQDRLSPDLLQRYGGVYATDCANPAAPRVAVRADGLVVEHNQKRMVGRKLQAAYSYYGNSPPPNYQVALLSEVRPGPGMDLMFTVFSDRRGPYITLDAGDKVSAALGKQLLTARYRHCEKGAERAPAAGAAAPPAPAARSAAESPRELLRDKAFAAGYRRALGPLAGERWLARLEGPAPLLRNVQLEGARYQLVASCKPHDCADNNLVLLWRADGPQFIGKVLRAGQPVWVGAPTPRQQAALEQLWRTEWRSGGK